MDSWFRLVQRESTTRALQLCDFDDAYATKPIFEIDMMLRDKLETSVATISSKFNNLNVSKSAATLDLNAGNPAKHSTSVTSKSFDTRHKSGKRYKSKQAVEPKLIFQQPKGKLNSTNVNEITPLYGKDKMRDKYLEYIHNTHWTEKVLPLWFGDDPEPVMHQVWAKKWVGTEKVKRRTKSMGDLVVPDETHYEEMNFDEGGNKLETVGDHHVW